MLVQTARRRWAPLILLVGTLLALPAPSAAQTAASSWGYITMRDGVTLRYSVALPPGRGPHPAVVNYAGYSSGTYPDGVSGFAASTFTDRGYAMVGVQARGSGCSGGSYRTLLGKEWADDAREVIDWIAEQPWATSKVGMVGVSFPGVTQWTAARNPSPHLAALVPIASLADPVRDAAGPGGIVQPGFFLLWGGIQNGYMAQGVAGAIAQGDTQCASNVASRGGIEPEHQPLFGQLTQAYEDELTIGKSAARFVHDIKIPTLAMQAWQDEAVGSRVMSELDKMVDPDNLWVIATNGGHDTMCNTCYDTTLKFLDHHLKGKANGWQKTPHTTLLFDSRHDLTGGPVGPVTPAWTLTDANWPPAADQVTLNLHGDGRMDQSVGGSKRSREYAYPRPSPSVYGIYGQGTATGTWQQPPDPTGQLAYTTPPLEHDAIIHGVSSGNLWLRSTATDTDVQVTLTEVRPDGQETYLTRGWLRASHRALDSKRSTALQPYHPHRERDAKPLTPGQPALLRVDIRPFAHAIREGSSLRLIVDAPTGATGTWTFKYLTTPATNTILTDPDHPSSLTFAVLRNKQAKKPLPTCDLVMNEVCRTDTVGVPSGSLTLQADGSTPPAASPRPPGPSATPPASVSRLGLSPKAFRAAARGAPIVARRRRAGTRVGYRLSAGARVRFTIQRSAAGRRVGSRCVKPRRSNRSLRRCPRFVTLRASFSHAGRAGRNSFRFTGRVHRRTLRPGRYRLVATPLAADGRRGRSLRTAFRIVR
jgi:putative CocE/NonD family hydrolase